jgi:Fe-S-cluster containining protein
VSRVRLAVVDQGVADRCAATTRRRPSWPCGAGCADCCRSLSREPEITPVEWERLREALDALRPAERARVEAAAAERRRSGDARPIVCPLLDEERGLCRVYEARPVECRSYGFYADRDGVLGCSRITAVAADDEGIVWGHGGALQGALDSLGPRRSLLDWLEQPRTPEALPR